MKSKICPICGKNFNFWSYEKRITCSNKCMGKYRQGKNHPLYKSGKMIKISEKRECKYCGKEYLASVKGRKYCSRVCGAKANEKHLMKGGGVPKFGQEKGGKTHKNKPKPLSFKEIQSKRMKEGGAIKARLGNSNLDTKIERKIKNLLDEIGVEYKREYPIKGYSYDFKVGNLIIECDGDYWHNYPFGTKRDREKDELAKEKGFEIIRFWESEIINDFSRISEMLKCLTT